MTRKVLRVDAATRKRSLTVFISHVSTDIRKAKYLKASLVAHGVRVFLAEHDLPYGEHLPSRLEREVALCDLMVVLWGSRCAGSYWVAFELRIAEDRQRQVVAFVYDAAGQLPQQLTDIKYIDASRNERLALDRLHEVVEDARRRKVHRNTERLLLAGIGLTALLAAP